MWWRIRLWYELPCCHAVCVQNNFLQNKMPLNFYDKLAPSFKCLACRGRAPSPFFPAPGSGAVCLLLHRTHEDRAAAIHRRPLSTATRGSAQDGPVFHPKDLQRRHLWGGPPQAHGSYQVRVLSSKIDPDLNRNHVLSAALATSFVTSRSWHFKSGKQNSKAGFCWTNCFSI